MDEETAELSFLLDKQHDTMQKQGHEPLTQPT